MILDGKTISHTSDAHTSPPPGSCRGLSRGWVLVSDQGLWLVRGGRLWLCGKRPYFVEIFTKVRRWQNLALGHYRTTVIRVGMFAARRHNPAPSGRQACGRSLHHPCYLGVGLKTFIIYFLKLRLKIMKPRKKEKISCERILYYLYLSGITFPMSPDFLIQMSSDYLSVKIWRERGHIEPS